MIISQGIDLVNCARVRRLLERHSDGAMARVFTAAEIRYCESTRRRVERYAARFAAKEAVMKALGTGWSDGVAWTDIEVLPGPSGKPELHVSGRSAEIARRLGITHWHISLTHVSDYAMASVIGEQRDRDPVE